MVHYGEMTDSDLVDHSEGDDVDVDEDKEDGDFGSKGDKEEEDEGKGTGDEESEGETKAIAVRSLCLQARKSSADGHLQSKGKKKEKPKVTNAKPSSKQVKPGKTAQTAKPSASTSLLGKMNPKVGLYARLVSTA